MNCKDKIKMILWNLGLRETIPASVINSVHIKENNEELVDIKQDKKLYFSDELQQRSAVYLRKSVYENIKKAQNALPSNYFFKVYSAFRPHEEQIQLWNKNYQEIKANNPTLSEQEIVNKTKAVCADPRFGFGGHQTGGAVDITLCDALGKKIEPNFGPDRKGDIKHSNADISKAKNLLGYDPDYDFAKGIALAIDWYKADLSDLRE